MAKKKQTKKENFAIARSIFGEYWIGKTLLKVNGKSIFSTFDAATEAAMEMTDSHSNILELQDTLFEECEIISKGSEKWIVHI